MAADAVSAVAGAVGSAFNTVTAFVNRAAQKYALQKTTENEGVSFERNKTLALYGVFASNGTQRTVLIVAMVIAVLFVAFLLIQKKNAH